MTKLAAVDRGPSCDGYINPAFLRSLSNKTRQLRGFNFKLVPHHCLLKILRGKCYHQYRRSHIIFITSFLTLYLALNFHAKYQSACIYERSRGSSNPIYRGPSFSSTLVPSSSHSALVTHMLSLSAMMLARTAPPRNTMCRRRGGSSIRTLNLLSRSGLP